MPVRACTVSFRSPSGIVHAVDVHAESLYEAAALGLAALKKDGWIEGLGPSTRLEVRVSEPATSHVVSVQQLQRWMNGTTTSPADVLRRAKLKKLVSP